MIRTHNRKLALFTLCLAAGFAAFGIAEPSSPPAPVPIPVRVAFNSDCEDMLIKEIQRATRQIRIAIFSINRKPILSALITAARRGVHVTVKYDSQMARDKPMRKTIAKMRKTRIKCLPITMESDFASMHHKFVVIDNLRVLTGSYNFTTAASTMNEENLVLIESPTAAALFSAHFDRIGEP